MNRYRLLLIALSVSGCSVAAAANPPCRDMFRSLSVCSVVHGQCYGNSAKVVDELLKSGAEPEAINALYITNYDGWQVHAVVLYNGNIYDSMMVPIVDGRTQITPVPIAEYFASDQLKQNSQVLEVSADYFLENVYRFDSPLLSMAVGEVPLRGNVRLEPVNQFIQRHQLRSED